VGLEIIGKPTDVLKVGAAEFFQVAIETRTGRRKL
jgi:hypothetical protein